MNVLRLLPRIVCLLALLVATTPGWLRAADEPYEINAILSLTGFAAFLGKDSQTALGIIEAAVNKSGGIRGRPIKFVIVDDHSDAQVAVQLANGLIAKHVPLFLGPGISAQCGAVLPLIATNGPVMLCFSPAIHPAAGTYGFVSGPSIPDYVVGTIRYLRDRGWKKIAMITSIDASGQDGDRAVDAALDLPENKSVTLVDREHFNLGDISVAAQMSHIKASGADAVIFWTSGTPFGTLLHGAFDSGLKIPIATTISNLNYTQLASYAAFMPDTLLMMGPPFAAADQLPPSPVRQRVEAYLGLLNDEHIKPAQGHVTGWDLTYLAVEALKRAGLNASAQDVRNQLSSVTGWAGVNGFYDFKRIPQRGIGSDYLFMLRWNQATQTVSVVSKAGGAPTR